jgi:DNA-binding SARP family transcriptional activator
MVAFLALLVEAGGALRRRDELAAVERLRDALRIGREQTYLSAFLWLPDLMARVSALALEHGIETEYVRRLVQVRRLRPPHPDVKAWPWPVRVYTLGRFTVRREDLPLPRGRKAQRRPLELLQAIVAGGSREAPAESLAEALWPDLDGDAAAKALEAALHRLRRLLGDHGAVRMREGRLSLDAERVWVDAWALERLLAGGEGAADVDRVLELYGGPLLADEPEPPWLLAARERIRRKVVRRLMSQGEAWEGAGHFQRAIDLYQRGLEADPAAEDLARRLTRCHQRLGRSPIHQLPELATRSAKP